MKFVDEAKIYVEGGHGGNGCMSFRREKFIPKGGPDGGDGGDGGSVYLVGDRSMLTLYDLKIKPHFRAERGLHGRGKKMQGRSGDDIMIRVPLGIVAYENEHMIGELTEHSERLMIAQGGLGGRGNMRFASAYRRSPRIAEEGKPGDKKTVQLILKVISDIGIVGFPNAGKSTLINALTNARYKTADYPFTTLSPNLGVLKSDKKNIILADMPGLIKDAHKGKGLGIRFLRHIERTRILILVIDISQQRPLDQYRGMIREFEQYDQGLTEKPRVIVFNKIDLLKNRKTYKTDVKTFYISALKGEGIGELSEYLSNED
jgi:GTP-binding protein